jgi:hypothetical protein
MLRFPDRPDALPLNPTWNFETTSVLLKIKSGEDKRLHCPWSAYAVNILHPEGYPV